MLALPLAHAYVGKCVQTRTHSYKQTRRACELRKAVLAFDSNSDSDADSDSDSELKTLVE